MIVRCFHNYCRSKYFGFSLLLFNSTMSNEKKIDIFIAEILNSAEIKYSPNGLCFAIVPQSTLVAEPQRALQRKAHLLDCWLHNKPTPSKFIVKTPIEAEYELLHSFFYFNDEISKHENIEKTVADYFLFEFNMVMLGREYLFENNL